MERWIHASRVYSICIHGWLESLIVLVAPAMRRYQAIPGGPKLESSSPYHQAMKWANGINSCRVCVESGKFALLFMLHFIITGSAFSTVLT